MEVVTILVSFGALIVSVITYNRYGKIHKSSLESIYFNEIWQKYLISKIPDARSYIEIHNKKLVGEESILDLIKEIRNTIRYYRFNDKKFYNDIDNVLVNLENYIFGNCDKTITNDTKFLSELDKNIDLIYQKCSDKYLSIG